MREVYLSHIIIFSIFHEQKQEKNKKASVQSGYKGGDINSMTWWKVFYYHLVKYVNADKGGELESCLQIVKHKNTFQVSKVLSLELRWLSLR